VTTFNWRECTDRYKWLANRVFPAQVIGQETSPFDIAIMYFKYSNRCKATFYARLYLNSKGCRLLKQHSYLNSKVSETALLGNSIFIGGITPVNSHYKWSGRIRMSN
jgi:hypothetical protein